MGDEPEDVAVAAGATDAAPEAAKEEPEAMQVDAPVVSPAKEVKVQRKVVEDDDDSDDAKPLVLKRNVKIVKPPVKAKGAGGCSFSRLLFPLH